VDYPQLKEASVESKRVLLRVDLDVPIENGEVKDASRLESFIPTVKWLLEKQASQVFLAGHMGRFEEGKESLSTKELLPVLEKLLEEKIAFGEEKKDGVRVNLLENLRATSAEEENDSEFAKKLASLADIYVNEAFASAHRKHASIVGIPKIIPGYLGLRFADEVKNLGRVWENPKHPVMILLSGVKEDKLDYLEDLKSLADRVLVAGRLPLFLGDEYEDAKVLVARLLQDHEDITIHSMEAFEREIAGAGTIVVSGPMGKYEEEGHRQGTKRVLAAVADSSAFKIAGGGDTEAAITLFGLTDKFDWISTGGGAMLEFLTMKTLPGLEVLVVSSPKS